MGDSQILSYMCSHLLDFARCRSILSEKFHYLRFQTVLNKKVNNSSPLTLIGNAKF